jgi:hypothetical protein
MLRKEPPFTNSEETKQERRDIVSAYNKIYYSKEEMPEKIGDLRELLQVKYEQLHGRKISDKKLDEFAYVWHPKYNFRRDKEVENQKYFQSYGCLTGHYYPSETSFDEGTLVTKRGVLPATMTREFPQKLKELKSVKNPERQLYICWLRGQPEPPFYNCMLVKPMRFIPYHLLKESAFFKVRGIVTRIESEKTFLKVQRNQGKKPKKTAFELLVLDCPEGMKVGEFWKIEAKFQEGFLRCKQAKQVK